MLHMYHNSNISQQWLDSVPEPRYIQEYEKQIPILDCYPCPQQNAWDMLIQATEIPPHTSSWLACCKTGSNCLYPIEACVLPT